MSDQSRVLLNTVTSTLIVEQAHPSPVAGEEPLVTDLAIEVNIRGVAPPHILNGAARSALAAALHAIDPNHPPAPSLGS